MLVRWGRRCVTGSSGWFACSRVTTCSRLALRKASSSGGIGLRIGSHTCGVCGSPRAGSYRSSSSDPVSLDMHCTTGVSTSSSGTTGVGSRGVKRFDGGGGRSQASLCPMS